MPENNSRIQQSNLKDLVKTRLTEVITKESSTSTGAIFYLGQVISNADPLKGNRLKIRLPLIDDIYYRDDKGNDDQSAGDANIPWCLPSNTRFIETPENGSVVLVALFDVDNPYLGRIWFNSISDETLKAIFEPESLEGEKVDDVAWTNAEKFSGVKYNFNPATNNRKRMKSNTRVTNFQVGIRGKNKNHLLFDEAKTTLIQNKGEDTESVLELTDKFSGRAKTLELLSTNTPKRKENPVFAKSYFEYQTTLIGILQNVVNLLNTVPALSPGAPVLVPSTPITPNPAFANIVAQITKLKTKLEKLKSPGEGASQYLEIN